MTRVAALAVGTVCMLVLSSVGALAENDWPQFRGLNAGVAPDHPDLPDVWSETENVVWHAAQYITPGRHTRARLELARGVGRPRVPYERD